MNLAIKTTTLTALALAGAVYSLSADPVEAALDDSKAKLSEAVPGKFSFNARLRFEERPDQNSGAASIRARYGYTTPDYSGFTAMVEGESLSRIGGNADDLFAPDNAGDGTDLNQLWVKYADADYGSLKLGRQIYFLDDHRFIGHVGWRQNIQTFDAVTFDYTGVDKLSLKGFYLDEQHNVGGAHNKLDAYGLNASYEVAPTFKLTVFYYDIEGEDVLAHSSETIGARATGSFKIEEVSFKYALSIAEQGEAGQVADYDATYYAGDISANISGFTLGAGFEILEPGFRTPLATLHKFNGWTDVFLGASNGGIAQGLEDIYVSAAYKLPVGNGLLLKAIYHNFSPETGPGDYGTELNLLAKYQFNKYFDFLAKYGDYQSDGGVGALGNADREFYTFEFNFNF